MARETMWSAIDMFYFWEKLMEWSIRTFGPRDRRGPKGPLDHLRKEALEAFAEDDPERRKQEIADCLFLVFDAAHRAGMSYGELAQVALKKLDINKTRVWPDWRTHPADKAVEHVRDGE